MPFLVELRAARPTENLMRGARFEQLLLIRRPFHDARHDDRSGRQIDARRKRLGAGGHGEQFSLKQFFDHAAILRQHAGMMHADAAHQKLLEFRSRALGPIVFFQLDGEPLLLAVAQHSLALELLGHGPAFFAIEAEDQGGRHANGVVALGHFFELLGQQHVADPVELQRHFAIAAGDQFEFSVVARAEPMQELDGVAHRGRQQQRSHVLRQQPERQFPNDAALEVVEAMELVHHHRADLIEVERFGKGVRTIYLARRGKGDSPHLPGRPFGCFAQMGTVPFSAHFFPAVQQPIQQNFGHDDQHAGVRVLAAVAGHQSHVFREEPPLDGRRLHFAELLLAQGDQRRGVVGDLAGVQRLEQRRLGDQRLARAGRRADHHPLLGREPRQQGLFLHRIRREGDLVEVAADKFVAGGNRVGGHESSL